MTKFNVFKLAIPENREEEFTKLCEKHNFLYAKTSQKFETNLKSWIDEKQMKF